MSLRWHYRTGIADEIVYKLDMPNNEVRKAFDFHVLTTFSGKSQPGVKVAQLK